MTAAVGLYQRLSSLPLPWSPTTKPTPVIIYGAATAVGAFAIKLAQLSNIHPLICVAGRGIPFAESLIDKSKGDIILDYRQGDEKLVQNLKSAVQKAGGKVEYAFDAVSESGSYVNIAKVLDPSKGQITTVLPIKEEGAIPSSVKQDFTYVGAVHDQHPPGQPQKESATKTGDAEFGFVMFRFFGRGLQQGWFSGHPQEVVPGGLAGVGAALKSLKEGKASATKYVLRIGDTEGVSG